MARTIDLSVERLAILLAFMGALPYQGTPKAGVDGKNLQVRTNIRQDLSLMKA
jgi:hypothetical protein